MRHVATQPIPCPRLPAHLPHHPFSPSPTRTLHASHLLVISCSVAPLGPCCLHPRSLPIPHTNNLRSAVHAHAFPAIVTTPVLQRWCMTGVARCVLQRWCNWPSHGYGLMTGTRVFADRAGLGAAGRGALAMLMRFPRAPPAASDPSKPSIGVRHAGRRLRMWGGGALRAGCQLWRQQRQHGFTRWALRSTCTRAK